MNRILQRGMVFLLVGAVTMTSGCEPLRKKFIRKKKDDTSENQTAAILDPVDYPANVKSVGQVYSQHYSLWKVWLRDLEDIVADNASEKRVSHTLAQMREHLVAMQQLLKDVSREKIEIYVTEVDNLSREFEKSAPFRNKIALTSRIHNLGRKVKKFFAPDKIKDELKSS